MAVERQLALVIPGIPPTGNHYKGYNTHTGRYFVKSEAKRWKAGVAAVIGGRQVPRGRSGHAVAVRVFLGHKQRLDADNALKVLLDALGDSGIFAAPGSEVRSDSSVKHIVIDEFRDRESPRTEIIVWPWEGEPSQADMFVADEFTERMATNG